MRVGHEAKGPGAGLFLDRVCVRELGGKSDYLESVFPCACWLDTALADCPLERELMLRGEYAQPFRREMPVKVTA